MLPPRLLCLSALGTSFALAALLLSEGLKDEAYHTAWGIHHVIYETKGYWFRTPEASSLWSRKLHDECPTLCGRPRHVIYETKGYWFRTPEAWNDSGNPVPPCICVLPRYGQWR